MSVYYFVDRRLDSLKKHKIMIHQIPEINPVQLLYNSQNPLSKEDLAELLGVSTHTICSWVEGRRRPSAPVKKLAAMISNQWSLTI